MKALRVERLHYSRISETVVRLDLDKLAQAAIDDVANRIGLGLTGFVRELGMDISDPKVEQARRNLLDKLIADRIEELRVYAGREPNDDTIGPR